MRRLNARIRDACVLFFLPAVMGCAAGLRTRETAGMTDAPAGADGFRILQTPGGVRFGLSGARPARPAPLLLVFSSTLEQALGQAPHNRTGSALAGRGWLSASLDLPCHGRQRRPDEPEGLRGWRSRVDRREDLLKGFIAHVAEVLDYLIDDRYADPRRIAACGTSRGAFAALHLAASEKRIRCVAVFSPVTELRALREFHGMARPEAAGRMALIHAADALAGRPVFVCIGDQDPRVGTDHAIAFARSVSAASARQNVPSRIELHVSPCPGGGPGHQTPAGAHEKAAEWIARQLAPASE